MDQALLSTAAVFTSGIIVGYLIRHSISRHRRARAKRKRRFFYEGALAIDNSYIENLSERAKAANPLETTSLNVPKEVTAAPRRPIMSFQRGAALDVPSAPTMV
jgi:hypothetical protein